MPRPEASATSSSQPKQSLISSSSTSMVTFRGWVKGPPRKSTSSSCAVLRLVARFCAVECVGQKSMIVVAMASIMACLNAARLNTPLKILLLCWRDTTHPQGGGSERYLERVGEFLADQGHEVVFR